jgi:hypothetical protein
VAALPLAQIENARAPDRDGGWSDYARAAQPSFKLGLLSSATLAAVAREFQVQTHLLSCSAELALRERLGVAKAREALAGQHAGVGWHAGARLARSLGVAGGGAPAVAQVLALHTALPPGFTRVVLAEGERVRLELEPQSAALLDPEHPGWLGLLARGEARGLEASAQGADARARLLACDVRRGRISAELEVLASAEPAKPPQAAQLMSFSTATKFAFDTSATRLGA